MKQLFIILISSTYLFSQSIYFKQDSHDIKKIEAKIITKIAKDFLDKPKIYIVEEKKILKKSFSDYLEVIENCKNANFVYIKKDSFFDINKCNDKKKIFFTNDKYMFKDSNYIFGAFFWFKSRPNIIISSKRAKQISIKIPKDYLKFVDTIK